MVTKRPKSVSTIIFFLEWSRMHQDGRQGSASRSHQEIHVPPHQTLHMFAPDSDSANTGAPIRCQTCLQSHLQQSCEVSISISMLEMNSLNSERGNHLLTVNSPTTLLFLPVAFRVSTKSVSIQSPLSLLEPPIKMELKLLGQAWGLYMFFRSLEDSYTGW